MIANRKCICCSHEYSYCPNCSGPDRLKPSWYSQFCSEPCQELWQTATRYNMGLIEKSEARDIISILSLKDRKQYVACVQRDLSNIFAEPKRGKRSDSNPVDEAPVCVEEVHEVVIKEENK